MDIEFLMLMGQSDKCGSVRNHIFNLHLGSNNKKKVLDNWCPMCQSDEDITEHVLKYNKGDKRLNFNYEKRNE